MWVLTCWVRADVMYSLLSDAYIWVVLWVLIKQNEPENT